MRDIKLLSKNHPSVCKEEAWGSDDRFTRCVYCGKHRYYAEGYEQWKANRNSPTLRNGLTVR